MRCVSVEEYLEDLQGMCLFDSAEFLYRAGIVQDSRNAVSGLRINAPVHMKEPQQDVLRARNLFYMREYYNAFCTLRCPQKDSLHEEPLVSEEEGWLRVEERRKKGGCRNSEACTQALTSGAEMEDSASVYQTKKGVRGVPEGYPFRPSVTDHGSGPQLEFCGCCTRDKVFIRNYCAYILWSIKGEKLGPLRVRGVVVPDRDLAQVLKRSRRMGGAEITAFDSTVFDDPYLVYLLLLAKRRLLQGKLEQQLLQYVIQNVPYFWDPYKMAAEIVTLSNIEAVVQGIPCETMRNTFMLYAATKKSVVHPDTYAVSEILLEQKAASAYVKTMAAAVYGHRRDNKKALELLEETICNTNSHDNLDLLSNTLYSLGDTEKISSLLLCVHERFYNLPIYNYVAGNLLSLKSNHMASIEQFQSILREKHKGEYDIAYVFVAQEYFHMKDTCSAIKACNLAIKKNYNDERTWSNMAQIYYSIELYEYALHFFRKCAELAPTDPNTYEGLGQCFERLNREEEAARCYRKGSAVGNLKCLALLGDLLNRAKKKEYAKCYLEYLTRGLEGGADQEGFCFETAERFIEHLEEVEDPKLILRLRKELTLLRS